MASVNGLSSGEVGLLLAPGALAVATLSAGAGRFSDRVGARPLVLAGFAVLIRVMVLLSSVVGGPVGPVAVAVFGMGLSFALIVSPVQNAAANGSPSPSC
ncbi:MAG: hypothetical protein M3308_00405 [Actinomycetota bacterium]|nr:hypothetical protein [Actinomycetota bacterium]